MDKNKTKSELNHKEVENMEILNKILNLNLAIDQMTIVNGKIDYITLICFTDNEVENTALIFDKDFINLRIEYVISEWELDDNTYQELYPQFQKQVTKTKELIKFLLELQPKNYTEIIYDNKKETFSIGILKDWDHISDYALFDNYSI